MFSKRFQLYTKICPRVVEYSSMRLQMLWLQIYQLAPNNVFQTILFLHPMTVCRIYGRNLQFKLLTVVNKLFQGLVLCKQ